MSAHKQPSGALSSLTAQYTDSDVESEKGSDQEDNIDEIELQDDTNEFADDGDNVSDEIVNIASNSPKSPFSPSSSATENRFSPVTFHRNLQSFSPDEISIPLAPSAKCPQEFIDKVDMFYEKTLNGVDMISAIQKRKNFRNPSIYEKLVAFCGIDEFGTNYPPELYDPHKWEASSFYEELSRQQKEEMDRHEKERKGGSKVVLVTGTAKKATLSTNVAEPRRKSKWDEGPAVKPPLPSTSHPQLQKNALPK